MRTTSFQRWQGRFLVGLTVLLAAVISLGWRFWRLNSPVRADG
jgi:hypothetical protein